MTRPPWEDNIRIDLKEIGGNMRNFVDSAQEVVKEKGKTAFKVL